MSAKRRIAAVIDVGSNSVRLLVARELSPVAFEVIDEERTDARLGQGQGPDGALSPGAIERGIVAVRTMMQVANAYEPGYLLAAGTEALRRAPNAVDFIEEVWRDSGVAVRVLSAEEEAYASFLGVVNSTALGDGAIVDIGGGSLELMQVRHRELVRAQSAPLGAIFATERYFAHDPPTAKEVRALRKAVRQDLAALDGPVPVLYGVGGAVRNLARIVRLRRRYPLRRLHGLVLDERDVHRLVRDLLKVSAEDRRRIPGVSSNRADILPAAAVVIEAVMELTGAAALHVAGQGLREGLVWQQLRPDTPVLPDVRDASIRGLALANNVDERLGGEVAEVARLLFEATVPLHGLGADELALLVSAARLADIGMHVDYYNRDRHAEYLVHSGDLHGFTHREIVLLGALVRWATSGSPDVSLYKSIVEPDDARRAAVLSALLGTARATHRRMPERGLHVGVTCDDRHLRLTLSGDGPFDAELSAMQRQQRRLESVLKVEVSIAVR